MFKAIIFSALTLSCATGAVSAINSRIVTDEERMAREEERQIIVSPIGGVENRFWFNYRANVNEARKELASDLRGASDTEDVREVWDEFRHELSHERTHYVREMAERGYRYGTVTVG
jgi:hypothetical protein